MNLLLLALIAQTALLAFAVVVTGRVIVQGLKEAVTMWKQPDRPPGHQAAEHPPTTLAAPAFFTPAARAVKEAVARAIETGTEDDVLAGMSDEELYEAEQEYRKTVGAQAGATVCTGWAEQDEREADEEENAKAERRSRRQTETAWWAERRSD